MNILVYHGTDSESAKKIADSKYIISGCVTLYKFIAMGYGDTLICFKIDIPLTDIYRLIKLRFLWAINKRAAMAYQEKIGMCADYETLLENWTIKGNLWTEKSYTSTL